MILYRIASVLHRYSIDVVSIHIARPWRRGGRCLTFLTFLTIFDHFFYIHPCFYCFVCHFQTHATVALLGLFCYVGGSRARDRRNMRELVFTSTPIMSLVLRTYFVVAYWILKWKNRFFTPLTHTNTHNHVSLWKSHTKDQGKQGRIHGNPSRMPVDRRRIWGHMGQEQ